MASSARRAGLALGLAGGLLGAALAVVGAPRPEPPRPDLRAVAQSLDGKLREAAAGLHARVSTLAELPRLAAAVSTDTATVRDLTREELAFRPAPGERITIGQVVQATGKANALLTLPEGASDPIALGEPGARLVLTDGKLALAEVVPVTPRDRADEVTGALAVTWPIDVAPVQAELEAAGASVQLVLPTGQVVLGRPIPPGAALTPLVLSSAAARQAHLSAALPPPPPPAPPLRPIGLGVALASILLGLGLARVGRARPAPAPPSSASQEQPGPEREAPPAVENGAADEAVDPTAGTALRSQTPRVGRYQVVRALGSGGMAEVFLARATGEAGFEKLVALKVLHRFLAQQPGVVESFLDEARLVSRLTHPNIVQIADLGRAGDEYFIAMEYIEGADLERLLQGCRARGEQVPLKVGLHLVRRLCDGLHAAHTATGADGAPLELVHRDVKGANVFVAKNGVVKVGDFGIAKANAASGSKRTEAGIVKGTAAYMAPEHRFGQQIDRRADLYAVGAVAYEVLTGSEVNLDLALLLDRGRQGWPHLPPPSTVRPDLPAALDAIVLRCLAYEREERWADCAALEEALERIAVETGQVGSEKAVAQWVEAALAHEPSKPERGA